MIPPDVANALRLQLPDQAKIAAEQPQNQPVASAQRITDVLSDLVPGQRILADIQALLPNGSYRAVVGQRDVTLALPFSAKPGDSLELEVTESDGNLALAFVAKRSAAGGAPQLQESVATSLSRTGKLIGDLMAETGGEGKRAPPVTLNGSQPLVEAMPKTAADLAPVLKNALTQSGMFYEAHQARWITGELPASALLQEPQGQASPAPHIALQRQADSSPKLAAGALDTSPPEARTTTTVANPTSLDTAPNLPTSASSTSQALGTEPRIPTELIPLIRQQLDGLANNQYAWQGQIWPGQNMWWEIGDETSGKQPYSEDQGREWRSRLKLTLPSLGDIDARLRLQPGGRIALSMTTDSPEAEARLRQFGEGLNQQLAAAGLILAQLDLQHAQPEQ